MSDTNQRFIQLIIEWDPFELGSEAYDLEVVDVLQAVHEQTDTNSLAKQIQSIYELSFEKLIPIKSCKELARQLMIIKEYSTCD